MERLWSRVKQGSSAWTSGYFSEQPHAHPVSLLIRIQIVSHWTRTTPSAGTCLPPRGVVKFTRCDTASPRTCAAAIAHSNGTIRLVTLASMTMDTSHTLRRWRVLAGLRRTGIHRDWVCVAAAASGRSSGTVLTLQCCRSTSMCQCCRHRRPHHRPRARFRRLYRKPRRQLRLPLPRVV